MPGGAFDLFNGAGNPDFGREAHVGEEQGGGENIAAVVTRSGQKADAGIGMVQMRSHFSDYPGQAAPGVIHQGLIERRRAQDGPSLPFSHVLGRDKFHQEHLLDGWSMVDGIWSTNHHYPKAQLIKGTVRTARLGVPACKSRAGHWIRSFISRTARAMPTMTARATMLWPMFKVSRCGTVFRNSGRFS